MSVTISPIRSLPTPLEGEENRPAFDPIRVSPAKAARKESGVTAAEFERLTAAEVECLLRRRLNLFVNAGATPCAALVLAAQVDVPRGGGRPLS